MQKDKKEKVYLCPECQKPVTAVHFACHSGKKGGSNPNGARKRIKEREYFKAVRNIRKAREQHNLQELQYWQAVAKTHIDAFRASKAKEEKDKTPKSVRSLK